MVVDWLIWGKVCTAIAWFWHISKHFWFLWRIKNSKGRKRKLLQELERKGKKEGNTKAQTKERCGHRTRPWTVSRLWKRMKAKASLPLVPVRAGYGVWDSAKNELFNRAFSSLEECFPLKRWKGGKVQESHCNLYQIWAQVLYWLLGDCSHWGSKMTDRKYMFL